MKLSEELQQRGFINQCTTDDLGEVLDGEKRTIYHGIDPTADSAHAGNFVVWVLLRHLAQAGHKIIFLVGGGTGMIGDPKPDVERPLTSPAVVNENVRKLRSQAEHLLGGDIAFVNNHDWLGSLHLIDFLRDTGKHFTVNELIKKDAIANRLSSEQGISYTEFAYPLLQAYDFLTLYRKHNCTLQVGGSDQWGNIVAGVDLIRRVEQAQVYAFTVPLIVDRATGKKFGKSEGNAIWIDDRAYDETTQERGWAVAACVSRIRTFGPLVLASALVALPLAQERVGRKGPASFQEVYAALGKAHADGRPGLAMQKCRELLGVLAPELTAAVLAALPAAPEGYEIVPQPKAAQGGTQLLASLQVAAGTTIEQRYTRQGGGGVTARVTADSPLLQMFAMWVANPALLGEDAELVKYGAYDAILKKKGRGWSLQIVIGSSLIDVETASESDEFLLAMFPQAAVDRLAKVLVY